MSSIIDNGKVLWQEYRALVPINTDPDKDTQPEALKARNEIVLKYYYLIDVAVTNMRKGMPSYANKDDVKSRASLGLFRAIKRYDHTLEIPFEKFAMMTMQNVIKDGVRADDPAPRSLRKQERDIRGAEETLKGSLGQKPSEQQVAEYLGIDVGDITTVKRKSDTINPAYIDSCPEILDRAHDPEESEIVQELRTVLAKKVQSLPTKEAAILALRYFENKRLADIASMLQLSKVRTGQLHEKAVLSVWEELRSVLAG